MSVALPTATQEVEPPEGGILSLLRRGRRDGRVTGLLIGGVVLFVCIILFGVLGPVFVHQSLAQVGAVDPNLPPSGAHLLGTDGQGRDVLAAMIYSTPETVKIGLIAGAIGVGIGVVLALLAGFFRGPVDAVIGAVSDSLLTIPGIAILIVIANHLTQLTAISLGLAIASLSWMVPTRLMRAQVLSVRERTYIAVARMGGESELEIAFREVMPNILPFAAASLVWAVSSAVLASVGLAALGLGTGDVSLGSAVYWMMTYSAVLRGEWWWFGPPMIIIGLLFLSLLMMSLGMDRFVNPRLNDRG
ncbi:MAG TPA: ABC transporter permease [Candidatus Dormibacteraeota bacterium]|jgi:peptide/nickel transport system permease protein|nr:ABC transporter permease [Candidatus Dormibacteraeota bacterium]